MSVSQDDLSMVTRNFPLFIIFMAVNTSAMIVTASSNVNSHVAKFVKYNWKELSIIIGMNLTTLQHRQANGNSIAMLNYSIDAEALSDPVLLPIVALLFSIHASSLEPAFVD
eukprot:3519378-Ditylum_brightwellii.AAC.1